jgi:phospholipase/carboxylesterase
MTTSSDLLSLGPTDATQRLVLLHGWGADADDLLDLGELLVEPSVNVVALRAPEPHPFGPGRQWYGLQPIDWDALPAAQRALTERLQGLGESVPLRQTVLLGFSQGAAMALDVGSRLPLAGIAACSGYPHQGWAGQRDMPPVLLTHGRHDPVVPFAASEEILRLVQASGGTAELLAFEGDHGIDASVLPQVKAFVQQCLHTR